MKTISVCFVVLVCNLASGLNHNSIAEYLQSPVHISNSSTTFNVTLHKSFANDLFGNSVLKETPNNDIFQASRKTRKDERSKRNVLNLYNMISCATGCNPLIYKGYGCFCGFLGSGFAVDGIDRCCKNHDWCYNSANCPYYLEYFIPYYWTCRNGVPHCCKFIGYDSCAHRLCECDRGLSNCLRRYSCPKYRAICETSPWRYVQNVLMNF